MEDQDIMLPEGYTGAEGEDLFDEASWGAGAEDGAGKGAQTVQMTEPDTAGTEESGQPPATGQEPLLEGAGEAEEPTAPTTGQQDAPAVSKLRFKARIDHQDRDVELEESELPGLYQRAQITERAQAKEAQTASRLTMAEEAAKRAGYDGLDSLLESVAKNKQEAEVRRLTLEGVHEDVAKDMAARKFAPTKTQVEQPQTADEPSRDYQREVSELLTARPELRGKALPPEVMAAAQSQPLMAAYYAYEVGQARAETERIRQENEILKQNAANAARAPVGATHGGGATDTKPEDDFLRGFNSY
jgi:hypothetical protein